jgi:flagellar hook-associated protein 2
MAITSTGLGSGLDVNGVVTQLMALERRPLESLQTKENGFQSKLTAYASLKGAFSLFQSTMAGLGSSSKFQSTKATVADASIFSVTASSRAVAGTHSVEVKDLALSHKLASDTFTNTTDTVGTGTLTIQFGTYNSGTNEFEANGDKAAQTVTIDASNSSLSGVRDTINAAKIGVTATILNDGTGNRLVLSSNDTGEANSLKITVSGDSSGTDTDGSGLSALAYDPTATAGSGKNLTETQAAQNALLKVDGLDNISKSSNVISDVIEGVTLTLLTESASNTPTTLSVSRDTGAIKKAAEDFVKAYNDLHKTVKEFTAYNATTRQGAVLQGESAAVSALAKIRNTIGTALQGADGAYSTLTDIGISFQRNGALALDSSKLQQAIDENINDIASLFAKSGKASDSLINFVSASNDTKPGSYAVNVTQLATRSVLDGTTTSALTETMAGTFDSAVTIDADNDTFKVKINGTQSATITLAQGTYASTAALTAEIQSKINGDSALKAAGASVLVSFDSDNDRLVITSDRYGSASKVQITQVDTTTESTLGLLDSSTGSTAVDVAGDINGIAATGSGRSLTVDSGDVKGLKIEVTGGSTGSRGTVGYSKGYGYQLDKLVGQFFENSGTLENRTKGLTRNIEALGKQRASLNRKLAATEKRLLSQFNAMDAAVGRLRSTSDYLSRQLTVLSSNNSNR